MVLMSADRLAVRAMGKFAEEWRGKSREERAKVPCVKNKVNEKWRRITGITVDIEHCMDPKERREGIRDLVKWIEEFVKGPMSKVQGRSRSDEDGPAEKNIARTGGQATSGTRGGDETASGRIAFAPLTPSLAEARVGSLPQGERGMGARVDMDLDGRMNLDALGVPLVAARRGPLGRATLVNEEQWACEGQAREVVVAVCAELNISRNKLSELTREYRGISATELIDGFRVRKIKSALAERVKRFARELWLSPGNYVGVLVSDKRLMVCGSAKSEFFVDGTEDFCRKELAETREERLVELIQLFDAGWREGGSSKDGFAVEHGFRSFSELNRACLNVWGKSARQVAFDVCGEVMDFYLAKEQEELRELACCERVTPTIAKARYLYWGSTKRPEGVTAEVSALWERQDAVWLERMGGWLGCV